MKVYHHTPGIQPPSVVDEFGSVVVVADIEPPFFETVVYESREMSGWMSSHFGTVGAVISVETKEVAFFV